MAGKSPGEYAYYLALIVAVLAGIAATANATNYWVSVLLVVLGIIVGFLNISEKESGTFLMATIALLVAGFLGTTGAFTPLNAQYLSGVPLGELITNILKNIAVFVAPAAVILAIKGIHGTALKK
jgi:hypothetical protein